MGRVILSWEPNPEADSQELAIDNGGNKILNLLGNSVNEHIITGVANNNLISASVRSVKNGWKSDPLNISTTYVAPPNVNFRFIFDYLSKADALKIIKQYVGFTRVFASAEVPDSLRPQGILCWLEFNQCISKYAYAAYKQIESAYLINKFDFVWYSDISRQAKIDILTGNLRINKSKIKTDNYVYCWIPTNIHAENLIATPVVFWSQESTPDRNIKPTPTQIKTALDQMPIGHRAVRLDTIVVGFYEALNKFNRFYFDGTPVGEYQRIWMDKWKQNILPIVDAYFAECKNLNAIIDYVCVDIEQQKNVFYFRKETNPAGEKLPHIDVQKDSRWLAFKNKFKIDEVDTMQTWDAGSNPKSHRWNAAVYNLIESNIEEIYNTIKKYYPDVRFSSYNGWEYCGGLYPLGDAAGDKSAPIGTGYATGTESSINLYATSGRMWWPHNRTTQDFPVDGWTALFTDAFKILSTVAASKKNQTFWIQPPSVANRIREYARCHMMMMMFMSDQTIYWNGKNSNSTAQDDQIVSEIAQELENEIAMFNNRGTPVVAPIYTALPTSTIEMSKDFGPIIKTLRIFKESATYTFIDETHDQFYRRTENG